MRYVLSILVLFFSISLMTASCSDDDTTTEESTTACSPTNPSGTCADGKTCNNGICEDNNCTPKTCADFSRTCGSVDDGCGTTLECGTCNADETCSTEGTCEAGTCTPDCSGKECGNDGCGGTCGTCSGTDTCNADGTCEAAAPVEDGDLGGNCLTGEGVEPCTDTTNLCLSADGGVTNTCYQPCNGSTDTSCTQEGAVCMDTGDATIGWICWPPAGPGTTAIGDDCSAENCVEGATCGTTDAGSICYEDCASTTDTCSTSGYTCAETSIGWLCLPGMEPGTTPIGGDCSAENCVEGATCGTTDAGSTCYEDCAATGDTCSTTDYACAETSIGWLCLPPAPEGTVQAGGVCDANNFCVDAAVCMLAAEGDTSGICYTLCDVNDPIECTGTDTCQSVDATTAICAPAQ